MAWSRLQTVTPTQGATPHTTTFGSACSPGSIIIVGVFDSALDTFAVVSVSDPINGSYNRLVSNYNSTLIAQIWYVTNTASTALTITVSDNDSSNHIIACLSEFAGGTTTSDGTAGMSSYPSTTSPTTNSIVTSGASDLIISVIGNASGSTISIGSGWTSEGIFNGVINGLTETLRNVGSNTYSGTANFASATTLYSGVIAALQALAIPTQGNAAAVQDDMHWGGGGNR